jgi:hypothetical protein
LSAGTGIPVERLEQMTPARLRQRLIQEVEAWMAAPEGQAWVDQVTGTPLSINSCFSRLLTLSDGLFGQHRGRIRPLACGACRQHRLGFRRVAVRGVRQLLARDRRQSLWCGDGRLQLLRAP